MASVMKDNEDDTDATEASADESRNGKRKPEKDEVRSLAAAKQREPRTGSFFSIYKKGQGYWTRMGTLISVTVLGLMLSYTLYTSIPTFYSGQTTEQTALDAEIRQLQGEVAKPGVTDVAGKQKAIADKQATLTSIRDNRTRLGRNVGTGVAVAFAVIYFAIALRLMNKPSNVDFLIATDSEMKKVNWTSRKELVGSSKVVILFMFFIAAYLFLNDIIYGYMMYLIKVLKFPPPPFKP